MSQNENSPKQARGETSSRTNTDIVTPVSPSRRQLLQLLGSGCVAGLAGCAGAPTGGDTGGTATIAMAGDPTKGRQLELYGGATPYTLPVLQTLTRATPDLNEIVSGLATDWANTSETTWEFAIREDVTFHNGVPLDAYVAAESLTGLLAERALTWAAIDENSFSALDDSTLEIETTVPSPYLPGNLAHPVTALHYRGDEGGEGPIGTGPFETGKVSSGEPITTTAYDDYWGAPPSFDELVFKGVPDDTTRTSVIRSGEVDVGLDLSPQDFARLDETADVAVRTQEQPRTVMTPFNLYKPPTDDTKLRLALNYAVDQESIVENIVDGIGTPATGPFAPVLDWSAHDSLPSYGPDMDRARELVEESSYDGEEVSTFVRSGSPAEKQIAEVTDGFPLSFKLLCISCYNFTTRSSVFSPGADATPIDVHPSSPLFPPLPNPSTFKTDE